MPGTFRIYFVRHGETDWNKTRKLQGQMDVPLNETGWTQSMLVGKALKDVPFVQAFSSDLRRALQTAECIVQYQSNVVLERDELIRERVSKSHTIALISLIAYLISMLSQYYLDESGIPGSVPLAETMPEFSARCLAWYTRSVEKYMISMAEAPLTEQPRSILVVSHGGWILTLLTALHASGLMVCRDGVEIAFCLNTGVSIIEYSDIPSGGRPLVGTLIQYSGVEHLMHENLPPLEVNKDVLGDAWWR